MSMVILKQEANAKLPHPKDERQGQQILKRFLWKTLKSKIQGFGLLHCQKKSISFVLIWEPIQPPPSKKETQVEHGIVYLFIEFN